MRELILKKFIIGIKQYKQGEIIRFDTYNYSLCSNIIIIRHTCDTMHLYIKKSRKSTPYSYE